MLPVMARQEATGSFLDFHRAGIVREAQEPEAGFRTVDVPVLVHTEVHPEPVQGTAGAQQISLVHPPLRPGVVGHKRGDLRRRPRATDRTAAGTLLEVFGQQAGTMIGGDRQRVSVLIYPLGPFAAKKGDSRRADDKSILVKGVRELDPLDVGGLQLIPVGYLFRDLPDSAPLRLYAVVHDRPDALGDGVQARLDDSVRRPEPDWAAPLGAEKRSDVSP